MSQDPVVPATNQEPPSIKDVSPSLPSFPVTKSRFLAVVGFATAALVAITVGLLGYSKPVPQTFLQAPQGKGVLYMKTYAGANLQPGSTITVALFENSGDEPVNAVQGAVTYPSEKLKIVSVKTEHIFLQEAATDTKTPGLVRIARGIKTQSPPVKGDAPIVTLEFKVLQASGSPIKLSVDKSASLLVRSTDNQNIL